MTQQQLIDMPGAGNAEKWLEDNGHIDHEVNMYVDITNENKVAISVIALFDHAYKRGFDDAIIKAKALYQKELPLTERVAFFSGGMCAAFFLITLVGIGG